MTPAAAPTADRPIKTAARWTSAPFAACKGCRWNRKGRDGSDWLAVRAAARRHVRTTSHHVWVNVTTFYAYRPADPGAEP